MGRTNNVNDCQYKFGGGKRTADKRFGTNYFNWNIGGIEGASFFMKEILFLASSYAVDLDIDPTTKLQRKCFL